MVNSVDQAAALVATLCALPGLADFEADTRAHAKAAGLPAIVRAHDSAGLFGWLMNCFSYQGISDRIASDYIGSHGNARFDDIALSLSVGPATCGKLASHIEYNGCGYRKTAGTCAQPALLAGCPVPALDLRKGDLNQLAYSLFLFVRDRCGDDIVGFIDGLFRTVDLAAEPDPIAAKRQALVRAFSEVHAVSAKLINMAFAVLLMAGDPTRKDWVAVGRSMVAIDTLVHNFLRRTGILAITGTSHNYGPACYGPKGCAGVIYDLTDRIEPQRPSPKLFPRLVQYAIWSFCAESQRNICNGRQIDDRQPCTLTDCPVGDLCSRLALRRPPVTVAEDQS